MIPPAYNAFFAASAGAAAALVGLLFVAVSAAPERIAGPNAPIERRLVAASVLAQLSDAFFISLTSLIPAVAAGSFVLAFAVLYFVTSVPSTAGAVLRAQGIARRLRRATVLATSVAIYGWQASIGLSMLRTPDDPGLPYLLAVLLLILFGVSVIRAWELLGASRFGLMGRLSPLVDVDEDAPDEGGRRR